MDDRIFVDAHGVEIFTRWWTIEDPRAVVLISHGASEHSRHLLQVVLSNASFP